MTARFASLFMLCLLSAAPSLGAPRPSSYCVGRNLVVLTYNVWGLPKPFLTDPSRFSEIAQAIPATDADIVAFQEAFTSRTDELMHARGPGKPGPLMTNSGLLVISRWPIIQREEIIYSACSGSDCIANKGALYLRIRLDENQDLDVFATHMNASDTGEIRVHQTKELAQFIRVFSGRRPLILLGDLNTRPNSEIFAHLGGLGIRDSHDEFVAANPGIPPHERLGYTVDRARNPLAGKHPVSGKIDYVLVRDLPEQPICTRQSKLAFDKPANNRFLSDHFGVLATLLLPH
jgi:endonuclease/exonuclease/phosphatase family metal-dependent hydrolase